jgi:Mn-containing catalase
MFYTDYKLQFPVRVEDPNPVFAKALQQAIGGIEGEIRVAMQYMFQAWGTRGNNNTARCCSTQAPRSSAISRC